MSRALRNDIAIALLVAGMIAVGPLTPNEWTPSLAIGALVGAAVFGWLRYRRSGRAADTGAPADAEKTSVPWLDIACIATFVACFVPTAAWMYYEWTTSVWQNNHGMFVPLLMFLLARPILRRVRPEGDDTTAWGFVPLGVGIGLTVIDSAAGTRYLSAVGLVVALPGLCLLLLGVKRTRALTVPLVMGLFMIPIPTTVLNHLFLRNATAVGLEPLLDLLRIPYVRDHSVLTLPDSVFVIGDACSGFATLYSALALSVFLACYCTSNRRRIALLLAFIPMALAANVIRVLGLILMARHLGFDLLDTALHEASGVASFGLIIVAMFALADRDGLRGAFG